MLKVDADYTSYDAEDNIMGPIDVLDSSSDEEDEARDDYTYHGVRPDRIITYVGSHLITFVLMLRQP